MRRTSPLFRLSLHRRDQVAYMVTVAVLLLFFPLSAHASPFDSGITSLQTLFTGTIARAVALIAIVLGGYGFAMGEPGAKKNLAGVAFGSGIAIMSASVLSWLWGA